jgi:hypothetical protein
MALAGDKLGTHFTCFTSTKLQEILTQKTLLVDAVRDSRVYAGYMYVPTPKGKLCECATLTDLKCAHSG